MPYLICLHFGIHAAFLWSGNLNKFPEKNKNMEKGLKSVKIEWSLRVGLYDIFNPVEEFTDFDVDSRIVRKGTSLTPRHQSMDFSKTHQGAAGVSLSNRWNECKLVHPNLFFHLQWFSHCKRLCLHPYIQHMSSCVWSCQDRLFHSPHHSLWVRPSTGDGWAWWLKDRQTQFGGLIHSCCFRGSILTLI